MIGSSGMGKVRVRDVQCRMNSLWTGFVGERPTQGDRFFHRPGVASILVAMAMRGEKAAAVTPEQRPELFPVGLRHFQRAQFAAEEETKNPFAMFRRQYPQFWFHLKQKHQPMG